MKYIFFLSFLGLTQLYASVTVINVGGNWSYYGFDFNGDTNNEVYLSAGFGTGNSQPLGGQHCIAGSASMIVTSFWQGQLIGPSTVWYCSPNLASMDAWADWNIKNIGCRLYYGGNYYYGWINLHYNGSGQYWISSYAYENVANVPILAGLTNSLVGVETEYNEDFTCYQNSEKEIVIITPVKTREIKITDLSGRQIYYNSTSQTNHTISLEYSGLVIVQLLLENGEVGMKKMIVS